MELPKYVYAALEEHEGCGFHATVVNYPHPKGCGLAAATLSNHLISRFTGAK